MHLVFVHFSFFYLLIICSAFKLPYITFPQNSNKIDVVTFGDAIYLPTPPLPSPPLPSQDKRKEKERSDIKNQNVNLVFKRHAQKPAETIIKICFLCLTYRNQKY